MKSIKTFSQRQKAEYIYKTYFDAESEHVLDFSFFDNLNWYGAIDEKKAKFLEKMFSEIGVELFDRIKEFDKSKF